MAKIAALMVGSVLACAALAQSTINPQNTTQAQGGVPNQSGTTNPDGGADAGIYYIR